MNSTGNCMGIVWLAFFVNPGNIKIYFENIIQFKKCREIWLEYYTFFKLNDMKSDTRLNS